MIISVPQAQFFFLALTRILATIIQVPVLGGQIIPTQVRLALGFLLTIFLVPWQPIPQDAAPIAFGIFAIAIGKEIIIGSLAGFAASLTFAAVQIAGDAMGLGSGFDSSRVFNPSIGSADSAFNQMFVMVTMMYFLVINGHHLVLIALEKMFLAIPLNGPLPIGSLDALLRMASDLIQAGIHLALPIMGALLLTDLTLGLLARVAPQIQVYFLGLPLKVGVSLAALGLIFMLALPIVETLYNDLGLRMLTLLGK